MVAAFVAIFEALADVKAIAGYVEEFAQAIVLWYVQRQNSETLTGIADAAALASRANNDEERYAAAQKWKDAISKPRVTAS